MNPKEIAIKVRELADDKKAEDILILDVEGQSSVADYFVIMHGNNNRHVKTLAEHIITEMKTLGDPVWNFEGINEGKWALLDFGSVIVHIFYKDLREFYGLERLWGDAEILT